MYDKYKIKGMGMKIPNGTYISSICIIINIPEIYIYLIIYYMNRVLYFRLFIIAEEYHNINTFLKFHW